MVLPHQSENMCAPDISTRSVSHHRILRAFSQVPIAARPVVRSAQLSQTIVAMAAAVEAEVPEAVAHLRYSRGSPLKVNMELLLKLPPLHSMYENYRERRVTSSCMTPPFVLQACPRYPREETFGSLLGCARRLCRLTTWDSSAKQDNLVYYLSLEYSGVSCAHNTNFARIGGW